MEAMEPKKHPPEHDDWWDQVAVKAKGPKDDPQAQEARSALHKHAVKLARATEEEAERWKRQLADVANDHSAA
jgi:hypothetical protein